MSFSVSVPATTKDALAATLDAIETPSTVKSEDGQAVFAEATDAFLRLAQTLKGESEYVCGSISGHTYEGDGSYPKNSVNVSVSETDAPVVKDDAPAAQNGSGPTE